MADRVRVPIPEMIYILMDDAAQFERIALPETDHRPDKQLRTKRIEQEIEDRSVMVVFQLWLGAAEGAPA